MSGWQPIKSAPLDGTRVLLKDEMGHVEIGYYYRANWGGMTWSVDQDPDSAMSAPVQWKPIDDSPVKGKAE